MIHTYKNGNCYVSINDVDGTKSRVTLDDEFHPEFPENIDVTLTRACSQGCKFCYDGCTPDGKHSDIMNQKWIETLRPYTELAINGNDLDHPQLLNFLRYLRAKNVFSNITVNQVQFERNVDFIRNLFSENLIHGLGVSLVNPTDEFISLIKEFPTAVIHTINGILTKDQIIKLADNDLKLLILGYKTTKRGGEYIKNEKNNEFIKKNQDFLYNYLGEFVKHFKLISFDNLAIEQLDVRRFLSDEEWDEFYMGDEGSFTFWIDAVEHKFAMNSIAPENERYQLMDDVVDMFNFIRSDRR